MKKNIKAFFAVLFFTGLFVNTNAQTDSVTDVDGNVYHTVKIGKQWWMQENLKTTHYQDGSAIPNIESTTVWISSTTGAWCYYENNEINNPTYGKLYNCFVATDKRNVCPTGWHVPDNDEFQVLVDYLGGDSVAGGKMKTLTLWNPPNTDADNSSGFSAVPGGDRDLKGAFNWRGHGAPYWSTTPYGDKGAWYWYLKNDYANFYHNNGDREPGFSIRCVKD